MYVLEPTLGPAGPFGVREDIPDQTQRLAYTTGGRPNRDINPVWGKVGLAMGEQRNVRVSDCFEDDVEFRRRRVLDQSLVDWSFRIIIELVSG